MLEFGWEWGWGWGVDGGWTPLLTRPRRCCNLALLVYHGIDLFQGIDFNFGDIDSNNYVFFGGLPSEYMRNLASLALPSVMFEHR